MRQSSSASSSTSADESADESAETPGGGWVLRATPKHHCVLPKIDARTFVGSVWQCGACCQHWEVKPRSDARPATETVKGFVRISGRRYEQLAAKARAS